MRCAHSRSCKSRNARSMKQRSASNKTNTSALQLIASSTASSISLSFGSMYGSGWTRQAGGIERAWHLGGRHYDGIARKRSAEVGERLSVLVGDWWAVQPARQAPQRSGRRYVRDGATQAEVAIVTPALHVLPASPCLCALVQICRAGPQPEDLHADERAECGCRLAAFRTRTCLSRVLAGSCALLKNRPKTGPDQTMRAKRIT